MHRRMLVASNSTCEIVWHRRSSRTRMLATMSRHLRRRFCPIRGHRSTWSICSSNKGKSTSWQCLPPSGTFFQANATYLQALQELNANRIAIEGLMLTGSLGADSIDRPIGTETMVPVFGPGRPPVEGTERGITDDRMGKGFGKKRTRAIPAGDPSADAFKGGLGSRVQYPRLGNIFIRKKNCPGMHRLGSNA